MSATFQFSSEMEESSPSTTSALNASRGVKTATFNIIITLWSSKKEKRICEFVARCVYPAKKTLLSARNTTSNFKKHLDTVHKATKLVGKEPAKETEKRSRDGAEDDDGPPGAKQQCTLLNKPAISRAF